MHCEDEMAKNVTATKAPKIEKRKKKRAYAATDYGRIGGKSVKGKPFGIGLVIEDEAGYRPLPEYAFATRDLAHALAERFNKSLGLKPEESSRIVSTSFRAHNIAARRR
jgi:hypothetical protein